MSTPLAHALPGSTPPLGNRRPASKGGRKRRGAERGHRIPAHPDCSSARQMPPRCERGRTRTRLRLPRQAAAPGDGQRARPAAGPPRQVPAWPLSRSAWSPSPHLGWSSTRRSSPDAECSSPRIDTREGLARHGPLSAIDHAAHANRSPTGCIDPAEVSRAQGEGVRQGEGTLGRGAQLGISTNVTLGSGPARR